MDEITLNGFEVFNDFMPGANVPKTEIQQPGSENDEDLKVDLDGVGEEMTDEELDELRKGKPTTKVEEEEGVEPETKPAKKEKKVKEEEPKEEPREEPKEEEPADEGSDEDQGTAVNAFFEAIADKLGWEIGEDDEVPTTPEELVEYFQNVIEENSVPQYASEEVEALDNFVKNGGNLRDYFEIDGELDLEEINLEDENNQKLIVKEFLKEKGFSTKQIEKKLTKYEEAGLLEDEAEDASEALREIREQKKQQLLKEQEKQAQESKKRQQEYFNSVVNEIKGMDNIRGIKIPEKDKKVLLDYIFKPDADGQTGFQKDWSKSVKNLLETAYFTMKGDTLLKTAKNEGSNNAINKFKESLNRTGVSRRTKKMDNTSDDKQTMWSAFTRQLRNN